jgi:hypothetical protein
MKKIYKYKFLCFALVLILLQSCETYFYYPTQQNVLQFSKKSDAQCSIVIGDYESSTTLGYAFTNNIAFITNFRKFTAPEYNSNTSSKKNPKSNLFENEIVLFKKFNTDIIAACNIGFASGRISNEYEWDTISIIRQFIQPSLGYKNKFFDFALSSRFSRVKYEESTNMYNVSKSPFFFAEPAITVGLGYKNIKLRCQKTYIQKLNPQELAYIQQSLSWSLNVTCNLEDMQNKQQKRLHKSKL